MTHPFLSTDYATAGARADVMRAHPLYAPFTRWQKQHFSGRFDPNDDRDRMLLEAFIGGFVAARLPETCFPLSSKEDYSPIEKPIHSWTRSKSNGTGPIGSPDLMSPPIPRPAQPLMANGKEDRP